GDTVLVMSSGDYGNLHDRLLLALGDPVMPARVEHKVRIGNLLDRVGIAHPVLEQFWPSYLVIPGEEAGGPLVGCVAIEVAGDVALLRMLAGAHVRRPPAVPGHRRRAGLLRREARLRGDRPQGRRARDRRHRRVRAGPLEERDLDAEGSLAMAADPPVHDPLSQARAVAGAIAREAATLLMQGLGTRPAVGYKSEDINLVTEYDKRSEALIVERLAAAFPADRIVAEEGTTAAGDPGAERVWYVDPLDGTTNFAHGLPIFSVSIGLSANKRPLLGIVE